MKKDKESWTTMEIIKQVGPSVIREVIIQQVKLFTELGRVNKSKSPIIYGEISKVDGSWNLYYKVNLSEKVFDEDFQVSFPMMHTETFRKSDMKKYYKELIKSEETSNLIEYFKNADFPGVIIKKDAKIPQLDLIEEDSITF